jgi:hypothetical protein
VSLHVEFYDGLVQISFENSVAPTMSRSCGAAAALAHNASIRHRFINVIRSHHEYCTIARWRKKGRSCQVSIHLHIVGRKSNTITSKTHDRRDVSVMVIAVEGKSSS